ncbi:MAG: energy transducer TonB [bacterium]|nr:energy transducer TonB [bacterium]
MKNLIAAMAIVVATTCVLFAAEKDVAPARLVSGQNGVSWPTLRSRDAPKFPKQARKKRYEAYVMLQGTLLADGSVTQVEVVRCTTRVNPSQEYGLEPRERCLPFVKAAKKAVRKWKYDPSLKDGKPVAVYLPIVVEFLLE